MHSEYEVTNQNLNVQSIKKNYMPFAYTYIHVYM